jgi:hypothetical protein
MKDGGCHGRHAISLHTTARTCHRGLLALYLIRTNLVLIRIYALRMLCILRLKQDRDRSNENRLLHHVLFKKFF